MLTRMNVPQNTCHFQAKFSTTRGNINCLGFDLAINHNITTLLDPYDSNFQSQILIPKDKTFPNPHSKKQKLEASASASGLFYLQLPLQLLG